MLEISVYVVGIGTPAEAQNYPWCAYYSGGGGGGGTNCGFTTFEQCMATARGLGSNCQPKYAICASTRTASADESSEVQSLLSYQLAQ
jgi:hypothetical protein